MQLTNKEEKLIGKWIYENGFVQKDEVSVRIEWLINNQFKKIGIDKTGWDVLYVDPIDNRLWELIYPESDMQGGGPPTLICISKDEAREKYTNVKLN
jgi:hypothetical protein